MRAYLHDNSDSDQHEAHDSGVEVSLEQLQELRVEYMRLDGTHDERMEAVDELCKQRSYRSRDEINHWSTPEEEYEPKRKMFYTEHMHEDEEIRLVVEGSGFFDLRDKENRWVRILVEVGDLLILPGGIYHRFSMDKAGHVKLARLFSELPRWAAVYLPEADTNEFRLEYLRSIGVAA